MIPAIRSLLSRLPGPDPDHVRGKVALVTGASKGIGAAVAAELAERGATVALLARNTEALAKVTASLAGEEHSWYEADVTSDDSMRAAVSAVVERYGRIDIVIANAGLSSYGSVEVCETETFQKVMDTNVTGVYRTVRETLPQLRESHGYVLVTASISSFAGVGGLGPYAASKAALEMLAHVLHLELDHLGIGVGTLYASWVDTDLISGAEQVMPAFRKMRRAWAAPADLPGLSAWPGGTATRESCARTMVDMIERRGRRAWVPVPLWGLSFVRVPLNSRPGERLQIWAFERTTRAADEDLRRNPDAPRASA